MNHWWWWSLLMSGLNTRSYSWERTYENRHHKQKNYESTTKNNFVNEWFSNKYLDTCIAFLRLELSDTARKVSWGISFSNGKADGSSATVLSSSLALLLTPAPSLSLCSPLSPSVDDFDLCCHHPDCTRPVDEWLCLNPPVICLPVIKHLERSIAPVV